MTATSSYGVSPQPSVLPDGFALCTARAGAVRARASVVVLPGSSRVAVLHGRAVLHGGWALRCEAAQLPGQLGHPCRPCAAPAALVRALDLFRLPYVVGGASSAYTNKTSVSKGSSVNVGAIVAGVVCGNGAAGWAPSRPLCSAAQPCVRCLCTHVCPRRRNPAPRPLQP